MSKIKLEIEKESMLMAYLFAFFIPFYPNILGVLVLMLWVEQWIRRTPIKKAYVYSQLSWKNPNIWLLLFYVMHLVGMIYTQNMSFAIKDIGMKASFAILPIFFLLYPIRIKWNVFINAFIVGTFLSIIVNFSHSIYLYSEWKEFNAFTGTHISTFMHRGYWSVYLMLAYYFVLQKMISSGDRKTTFWGILGAVVILVMNVFTESKIGMLLFITISVWMGIQLFLMMKNKLLLGGIISVFIVGIFVISLFLPTTFERITKAFNESSTSIEQVNKENPSSTESRMMVWDSSIELIKENPVFGVGTGDIKDVLIERNYEKGYVAVAEQKLNCHNQFFNTQLALGMFGTLFLLMSFVTNLFKKSSDTYYSWRVMICVLLFLAILPESMLETQAGIIPFAFLLGILSLIREESLVEHSNIK